MKSYYWILFPILLASFFRCDIFQSNPKERGKDQISGIFSESLFDYFENHNQALDAIEAFTQDGLLKKKPATLIHFDSHSDMYRVSKKDGSYTKNYGHSYGDFLNLLILERKVEEIFWVVPDESRAPENQEFYWNHDISADKYPVMFSGPPTQTFYVDERDKDIYFDRPEDYTINPSLYRTVTFHKVILEELTIEKSDRPIIVDIDADYFSNQGYDTANEMVVIYKEQNIARFLSALEKLGIKPMLTMGALSPDYIHDKDKIALERFFQDIGESARKGDYLIGYKHHDKDGEKVVGSNIRRQSKQLYQALYEMSYIDLRTDNPDYKTPVNDTSAEYKKLSERIQIALGVSEQEVNRLMLDWDNEDGVRDSIVDYYQIEQNIQITIMINQG